METKQVIVLRKDLNMRKGKMVAQGCHASMKVILDRLWHLETVEDIIPVSFDVEIAGYMKGKVIEKRYINLYKDEPLYHWLNGLFTKVVVGCDSEAELFELKRKADEAGIMNAIIQDSGKTEFNGIPTYTALAIGPDTYEKIDLITGHLKLL